MRLVLIVGCPLQIAGGVVLLVSVQVVYFGLVLGVRDERSGDQSMHWHLARVRLAVAQLDKAVAVLRRALQYSAGVGVLSGCRAADAASVAHVIQMLKS